MRDSQSPEGVGQRYKSTCGGVDQGARSADSPATLRGSDSYRMKHSTAAHHLARQSPDRQALALGMDARPTHGSSGYIRPTVVTGTRWLVGRLKELSPGSCRGIHNAYELASGETPAFTPSQQKAGCISICDNPCRVRHARGHVGRCWVKLCNHPETSDRSLARQN